MNREMLESEIKQEYVDAMDRVSTLTFQLADMIRCRDDALKDPDLDNRNRSRLVDAIDKAVSEVRYELRRERDTLSLWKIGSH